MVDLGHLVEEALVECFGPLAAPQGGEHGALGCVLQLECQAAYMASAASSSPTRPAAAFQALLAVS